MEGNTYSISIRPLISTSINNLIIRILYFKLGAIRPIIPSVLYITSFMFTKFTKLSIELKLLLDHMLLIENPS